MYLVHAPTQKLAPVARGRPSGVLPLPFLENIGMVGGSGVMML